MNRLENYRSRYASLRPTMRPGVGALEDFKPRPSPPPVFLTRRFWEGVLWIGMLNFLFFYSIRNVNMNWLFPPVQLAGTGPKKMTFPWPKGLVPLTVEHLPDGETLYSVPTQQLTPEQEALLKKIWESQSPPPPPVQGQTSPSPSAPVKTQKR